MLFRNLKIQVLILSLLLANVAKTDEATQVITNGSRFTIKASDIQSQKSLFTHFHKKPKIYIKNIEVPYTTKTLKKASTKVLTKTMPTEYVDCEWKKKIVLYNKKVLKEQLKSGVTIDKAIIGRQKEKLELSVCADIKLQDRSKEKDVEAGSLILVPPMITKVEGDLSEGSELTISGHYFGKKAPKVLIEYKSGSKIKLKNCKVDKSSYSFSNANLIYDKNSIKTGESQIKAIYPKFKAGKDSPTGNIVIDNGLGLAVINQNTTMTLTMGISPSSAGSITPSQGAHTLAYGQAQKITAEAASGYQFSYWASDDNSVITDINSSTTTLSLSDDATVTAIFIESSSTATLTMAVSPSEGGTCNPDAGESTVNIGETQSISASAATGYTFSSWSTNGNATIADSSASSTTVTLTGDATITAIFTESGNSATLTMKSSPSSGGSTSPSNGSSTVSIGQAQSIKATAASGYEFSYWSVGGNGSIADTSSSSTTVTLTGDATVTATFIITSTSATLTMAASPSDAGSTSPSIGTHNVSLNQAQSIKATATSGYEFSSWSVSSNGSIADSSSSSTTVTLSGDATVTATFIETSSDITLTMAVSPTDAGETDPSVGSHSVKANEEISISATASNGYSFSSWSISGDGSIDDNSSASTSVTLTGDATVTATFTAAEFTISSSTFQDNQAIPKKCAHSPEGSNTSPNLQWANPPSGTKSFVITCIDKHSVANNWVHWMVINIPSTTTNVSEGSSPSGGKELNNSWSQKGWGGPYPPVGSGTHRYVFTVYALDTESISTSSSSLSESQLKSLINNHIISSVTITGTYSR